MRDSLGGWRDMDDTFRALARRQIIFATAGMLFAAAGQVFTLQRSTVVVYTISGAFLGLALYAGQELGRGTKRGILLSLVVQALQIVQLNFPSLGFFFLAGPFVELGASSSILLVTGGAGALGYIANNPTTGFLPGTWLGIHFGFQLSLADKHPTITVGVNIVALVFAIRLWRLWRANAVPVQNST